MKVFTASFFGHRQIDNVFVIEQRLQEIIQELLISKEYVEFLVGRNGEFDQLVVSTVRRCKRTIVMTTAHWFLFCPIQRQNTAIMNYRSMNITMRWRSAQKPQNIISSLLIKSEIVSWLTVRTWLFFAWNTTQAVLIKQCSMQRKQIPISLICPM